MAYIPYCLSVLLKNDYTECMYSSRDPNDVDMRNLEDLVANMWIDFAIGLDVRSKQVCVLLCV